MTRSGQYLGARARQRAVTSEGYPANWVQTNKLNRLLSAYAVDNSLPTDKQNRTLVAGDMVTELDLRPVYNYKPTEEVKKPEGGLFIE